MASRSLGTLTLDLVAKTSNFTAGLDKAGRDSQKWRRKVKRDLDAVASSFKLVGVGAAAGLATMAVSAAKNAKEIKNLSLIANTNVESLQALSFAARQYGVDQEKVSDVLKDTTEKIGDFLQTGGGAMADYFKNIAPLVGHTAEQFRQLSGDDALKLYVRGLEQANLSQAEMTFYMEAIASDASQLLPLLKDNGKELKALSNQAENFGAVLDEVEVQQLAQINQEIDALKGVFQGLSNEILSSSLPAIRDLTSTLADPETLQGIKTGVTAAVKGVSTAIRAMALVVNEAKFVYDEFRARIYGPASDDIVRLEQKAERLSAKLAKPFHVVPGPIPIILKTNAEEVRAELAQTEQQIVELRQKLEDEAAQKIRDQMAATKAAAKVASERAITLPVASPGLVRPVAGSDDSAERYIESLRKQQEMLGKTQLQIALYADELKNATPAQRAEAEAVLLSIDAYNKKAEASQAAIDAQKAINDQAEGIRLAMRTEEQVILDSYKARHDIVIGNTQITGAAQQKLLQQLAQERDQALANTSDQKAEQARQDALASQVDAIRQSLLTEEQAIKDSYSKRREIILQAEQETGESHKELLLQLKEDRDTALAEMEAQRQIMQLQNAESLFGNLSALSKQFAGEESRTYQALFALEKAAGIARSIVAIKTGIANAFTLQYPENMIAAASVANATANIVTTIKGTQLTGQAHDGLMNVPQTGTYLLEKGERVTTEKTSAKLDATLDQVQATNASGGMGGDVIVHNSINAGEMAAAVFGTAQATKFVDNRIKANKTVIQRMASG